MILMNKSELMSGVEMDFGMHVPLVVLHLIMKATRYGTVRLNMIFIYIVKLVVLLLGDLFRFTTTSGL